MITTAVLNQKGGVGKTSLTMHLGGALADAGKTVLLVDYDPQASLTQGFLGPDDAEAIPFELTVATVAAGNDHDPQELVRELRRDRPAEEGDGRLLYAPGSRYLGEWNLANPHDLAVSRMALRRFLAEAWAEFRPDLCLIDCPPNLSMCAAQALAAAEFLLVPVQAEDYGAQGLKPVLEFLARAQAEDNPALSLAGIALNMVDPRLSLHKTYEARLRKNYGAAMFRARVPVRAAYKEAITFHLPITWHDRKSDPAEAMRALAGEFLERTGGDLP